MNSLQKVYIISATLVCFLTGGFVRSTTIVFEAVLGHYNYSEEAISWLFSFERVLSFMLACVPAMMTKKFGFRTVLLIGGILKFIGLTLTGFAQNIVQIYITLGILTAFGTSFSFEPTYIAIAHHFKENRGCAVGILGIGGPLGGFVLPPLTQYLLEFYGFKGAFMLLGAISFNVCVGGALMRPFDESTVKRQIDESTVKQWDRDDVKSDCISVATHSDGENNSENGYSSEEEPLINTHKNYNQNNVLGINHVTKFCYIQSAFSSYEFMMDARFVAMSIVQFSLIFGLVVPSTFLAGLASERSISAMYCALLLSVSAAVDIIAKLVIGPIFDYPFLLDKRDYIFGVLVVSTGISGLALPFCDNATGLEVAVVVHSAIAGPVYMQYLTVVTDTVGREKLPEAKSILGFFQGLGGVLSPAIGGIIKSSVGSYDLFFLVAGILKTISGLLYLACSVFEDYRGRII